MNHTPAIQSATFRDRQVSLRKLFLTVLIYAVLFGFASALSLPGREALAAALVLTIFVLLDLRYALLERHGVSNWERQIAFVAYYATGFACSAAACLPVFLLYLWENHDQFPASATPPGQAKTLGDLLAALAPLIFIVLRVVAYLAFFTIFSAAGFLASLVLFRRARLARWLCLVNLPAAALVGYCLAIWFLSA